MGGQKYLAFVKTVELGSLTKAARMLGYTQSGISHMISALEEEAGMCLLHRDRSGVRLTGEGELLLPYFTEICNSQRQMENKIKDILELDTGILRIGAFTSVSVQWLPYIIKEFLEDFPRIEFEILYGEYAQIEEWILEGRADLGFLSLPSKKNLKTIFLKEDELVVILPAGHPLKEAEEFPPNALEEYPYALVDEGEDYEVEAVFDHFGVSPKVTFTAKEDQTIVAMVANGLCISVMPRLVLEKMPYEILKKSFPEPVKRRLGIAYKDKKRLSHAAERFLDYVEDWVKRNIPAGGK